MMDFLTPKGSVSSANNQFKAEEQSRMSANGILSPTDAGGDYDPARELYTTLDGEVREITADDLATFRRRIGVLKRRSTINKIKGGIRPQQVIQFSHKDDIQRSNSQINLAILTSLNKGLLRFKTNSGPDSDRNEHYVFVELVAYKAALLKPIQKKQYLQLARELVNAPVKFDCDCGRHTFWYRYIASTGDWNYGRLETGYPKIRNPRLMGVACKHVLRVMRELVGSRFIAGRVVKMLETNKPFAIKKAEAQKQARTQRTNKKDVNSTKAQKQAERILRKDKKEAERILRNSKKVAKDKAKAKEKASNLSEAEQKDKAREDTVTWLDQGLSRGLVDQSEYDDKLNKYDIENGFK